VILDTTVKLEVVLAAAIATSQPEFHVHFRDRNKDGQYTEPGLFRGATNSMTDVTLLAAPGDNFPRREIEEITLFNADTAGVTFIIKTDDGTTERRIFRKTVEANGTLQYMRGVGWFREAVV
jgi:hypothetical protein